MNVRIGEQDLRFKITEEELKTLLAGQCLHVNVGLLNKTLVATINPQGSGESMESKLVLDDSEAYLNLLIPPGKVEELSDMGRSRAGLKASSDDGLSISLQVDMRADSRKVGAG
ncbi:MAG: hypothetical protein DHS20C02_11670 [Micavibrio sp.]|nr:MAG: hypothetical protein DHS20C02_11670 [Micavibrio sp.]